jgi:hypothetical protein
MVMEKIVVGRDASDLKKFGDKGTVFIGKHVVGTGEEAHLTNPIYMDVTRPHVVLVCGKRGSGKSYSAGVVAEEMVLLPEEVRNNLSVLMIDTMGIYWSMKRPNEKDNDALREWGLKPTAMESLKFFIPKGYAEEYEKTGVDYDFTFTLPCSEVSSDDWSMTFGFSPIDDNGIVIERVIKKVRQKMNDKYSIEDIISEIESDSKCDQKTKDMLVSRFNAAQGWGVFEETGTAINDFFKPGEISVVDISHYPRSSASWSVRSMVIGLLCRKIFQARLMARKAEEIETITGEKKKTVPMVWIMMDEAHQFIPSEGETAASGAIHTLIKEGREPGISMLLITQIPNKLHKDVLAQTDLVISHRLTLEADLKALQSIMQTYMIEDIKNLVNNLPRMKGAAVVLDDNSERVFAMQMRPRLSWHAGGSPQAIKEKSIFD